MHFAVLMWIQGQLPELFSPRNFQFLVYDSVGRDLLIPPSSRPLLGNLRCLPAITLEMQGF